MDLGLGMEGGQEEDVEEVFAVEQGGIHGGGSLETVVAFVDWAGIEPGGFQVKDKGVWCRWSS